MPKPKRVSVAKRDLNDRPHILYRFWDSRDVLLYVGISVDSASRIANHMRDQPWWSEVETIKFTTYPNRKAALEAEAEMIRTLKPLYNVVHNEMVEEDVAEDTDGDDGISLADLPCVVLSELDNGDREFLLRSNATDFDGNSRTEEQVHLHAAIDAITEISYDRTRLKRLVQELMEYLHPQVDGGYLELAESELREWRKGGHVSDFDITRVALDYYVDFRGRQYLERLGSEQAEEWRERMRVIHGDSAQIHRQAARDARAWHVSGWYDKRGCLLEGTRGALCPRLVGARIWYEICLFCATTYGRDCEGHQIFCVEHAEQAARGDLAILEQTRLGAFPVARWERMSESVLDESPF